MSTLTFMYQKFQEIHNMVCSRRKRGEIMTRKETYESRTEQFLLPLLEEHQFELVDVEYVKEAGNWYLRAYIDKEGRNYRR